MSLSLYNDLNAVQYGFPLNGYYTGGYALAGTFLNALNSYTVSLISFVDMSSYVGPGDIGQLSWLVNLNAIANIFHPTVPPVPSVLVMAVLYNNGSNVGDPDVEYPQAITRAGLAAGSLRFFVQRNDVWAGSAAESYRAGFSSAPTGAFSYLLYKRGTDQFRVVDKVHTASADSGSGDAGEKIGFAGWTPNYANLQAFITRRINDHLDTAPAASLDTAPAYIKNGDSITVRFPEKAIGAATQANFVIRDGATAVAGVIQPPVHTDVSAAAYVADSDQETTDVTFQNLDAPTDYNDRTFSLELAAGLTDTSGAPYALSPAASFVVDTVGPTADLSDDHADAIVRDADTVTITATFTEAHGIDQTPANAPRITIGSVVTNVAMTRISNLEWRYAWDVPAGNDGPHAVSLTARDVAGNPLGAVTGKTSYTIDNTRPTADLSDDHADAIVRDADTVTITATFTEAHGIDETPANAPRITIGSVVTNAAMTRISNLEWRYAWDVPAGNDGPHAVSLTARDVAGNSLGAVTGKTNYTIDNGVAAPPQNIVLVLDYSGTMDDPATFGTAPDIETKAKVEWVKDAVVDFVQYLLDEVTSSDYNVGIVLYSTGGLKALDLTPKSSLGGTTVSDALAQVPVRERTAMGKGMAWALDMLGYDTPSASYPGYRAIVLLADGQQNVNPFIEFQETDGSHDGMDQYSIATGGSIPNCPTMPPITVSAAGDHIPVHTLGIGGTDAWFADLSNLSDATNATHYEDTEVWPNVMFAFTNLLPSLFPYSSPQIVRSGLEHYQAGAANQFTVDVNGSVHKLTVCLNWVGSAQLSCRLGLGGKKIYFDSVVQKDGLFIGTVIFPHHQLAAVQLADPVRYETDRKLEWKKSRVARIVRKPLFKVGEKAVKGFEIPAGLRTTVGPAGSWQIFVEGGGGAAVPQGKPFLLSVIADEKEIKYEYAIRPSIIWAGEKIPFHISLFRKQVPVGTVTATARVSAPTESLANILGKEPGLASRILKGSLPQRLEDVPKSLHKIIADKKISSAIAERKTKVVLLSAPLKPESRKSGYSSKGAYADTKSPGSYGIELNVECEAGKGETYRRVIAQRVIVLPKPDFKSSRLDVKMEAKKVLILFTPMDGHGNYLGAGFGRHFGVELEGVKVAAVTDQLNGSYLIEARLTSKAPSDLEKAKQAIFNALMAGFFGRGRTIERPKERPSKPAGKPGKPSLKKKSAAAKKPAAAKKAPAKKTPKKAQVKKAVKKPAKTAVKKTVKKAVKKPVKKAIRKPVKKPAKKTAKRSK